MLEGYAGGTTLHIIKKVRFLPPLLFWMITNKSSFLLDCQNWPDSHKPLGFDEPLPILILILYQNLRGQNASKNKIYSITYYVHFAKIFYECRQ